ncbi:MAG: rane protein [Candidatus Binatota bacterium]|nr:rane protein [Candidatus Binatota bacterium]
MSLREAGALLRESANEWSQNNASRLAAALAYYTVFSLAPLLVIVTAIAGFFFGADAVRGRLDDQLQGLVGSAGADVVQELVRGARREDGGTIATLLGVVTLILGATGAFGELQAALNTIWHAPPRKAGGMWELVRIRLLSFTMVVVVGFLLLVSLVVSALLSAVGAYLSGLLPLPEVVLQLLNFAISIGVETLLFALMFKILPDVVIPWSDVWVGAGVTALLFEAGKFLIGLYLGRSGVASTYGAAGSFAVLLLWVYYSGLIFFFGAEFTETYSRWYGSRGAEERQRKVGAGAAAAAGAPART